MNIPDVKSRKTSFVNPNNKRKRSAKVKTHKLEKEVLEEFKQDLAPDTQIE